MSSAWRKQRRSLIKDGNIFSVIVYILQWVIATIDILVQRRWRVDEPLIFMSRLRTSGAPSLRLLQGREGNTLDPTTGGFRPLFLFRIPMNSRPLQRPQRAGRASILLLCAFAALCKRDQKPEPPNPWAQCRHFAGILLRRSPARFTCIRSRRMHGQRLEKSRNCLIDPSCLKLLKTGETEAR